MENCTSQSNSHVNGFCSGSENPGTSEEGPKVPANALITSDSKSSLLAMHTAYQQYYRNKLTAVEKNGDSETEVEVLRNYLDQLEELNSVLILTMTELQTEVEERVAQMERRLKSSAKTTMEAVVNLHECEQEMSRLVNDRLHLESLTTDMQQQISSVTVENNFLRDQNFNFIHDIQALLHIIHHARSTGHWEMDCVTFCEVTPEQVFGPVQSLDNFHVTTAEASNIPIPNVTEDCSSQKCLAPQDQSLTSVNEHSCKNSLLHSFSVPTMGSSGTLMNLKGTPSKSDPLCLKKADELFSKSVDIRHLKNKMIQKGAIRDSSCDMTHRSCYGSYLRKAFSEPHLFIFGDNIYVYRPCESVNQELSHFSQEEEDCKFNLRACQSIDLKLPCEESACKYTKSCKRNLFYNSKVLPDPNSSSLPCNMDQISLSSCSTDSEENSIVNDCEEMEEKCSSRYCKCLQNAGNSDELKSGIYSPSDDGSENPSCYVQTDNVNLFAVGVQTNISDINSEPIIKPEETAACVNCDDSEKSMQIIKESLLRAEDKVCAQVILIKELQTHLNTVMKELESKEDKIKELENQEKNLQDQKRSLMIQLDAQGDELEHKTNEIELAKRQLQKSVTQMEQQSIIIKSLQEALVQSKRALDEKKPKHSNFVKNSSNLQNQSVHSSRNSIVDL